MGPVDELEQLRKHLAEREQALGELQDQNRQLRAAERRAEAERIRLSTALEEAQRAAAHTEQRYRHLCTSIGESFALVKVLYDEAGQPYDCLFLDLNPAALRRAGRQREDYLGKTMRQTDPTDAEAWIKVYGRVSQTGQPACLEVPASGCSASYKVHAYSAGPDLVGILACDVTERKRANEELARKEATYRSIAQCFPNASIYVFDRDLRYQVVEGEELSIFGQVREQMEGKTLWETLDPETVGLLEPRYRRTLAGESLHFETQYGQRHKNRIIASDYRPIRDEAGQVVAGLLVARNITDEKRAQGEMQRQREQYQALAAELEATLSSIADGLVVYDIEGRIVRTNAAADAMLGYSAEAQRARIEERSASVVRPRKPDGSFFMPDEYPAVRALRGEVVHNEDMILQVPARKGDDIRVSVSSAPIHAVDGAVTGCVTTFTNTEAYYQVIERLSQREASLAQIAERLGHANAELEAVVSAIPDALIVYDCAGKIVHINDVALNMLGYPEDTWKLPVSDRVARAVQLFGEDGRPLQRDQYPALRVIRGEVLLGEEHRVHLPERPENDFWGMFSARPIMGPDLQVTGAVLTWSDTSRLHEANQQLARANAQLEAQAEELRVAAETLEQRVLERTAELARANAELSQSRQQLQTYSYRLLEAAENERRTIARELHDQAGQLLTSLMLGLGVLERRYSSSEPACRHIAYLKQIADDLSKCIHELAVSLRPASLDRVGLGPALRQLTEMLQAQSHLEIELVTTGINERLGPDVETTIYRIVQESLTNVMRHAQATRAGVVVQRQDNHVTAIIEDNGRGFDSEGAWRSERLGLTGMRERAEMLGGTLVIETQPGCGTAVFVELPCQPHN